MAERVRVTRQRLEGIYRRYGLMVNQKLDRALIASSRALAGLNLAVTLENKQRIIKRWKKDAGKLYALLIKQGANSAYHEQNLRRYLAQPGN